MVQEEPPKLQKLLGMMDLTPQLLALLLQVVVAVENLAQMAPMAAQVVVVLDTRQVDQEVVEPLDRGAMVEPLPLKIEAVAEVEQEAQAGMALAGLVHILAMRLEVRHEQVVVEVAIGHLSETEALEVQAGADKAVEIRGTL